MELPSIYAPNGLSKEDQRRVITVGSRAQHDLMDMGGDEYYAADNGLYYPPVNDVEMMAMDDMEEAQLISDIVASSRIDNDFAMSDEMELDRHMLQTTTVSLQGNVSYLIIDTNFILSQIRILDELKNIGEQYGLVIVIPIQVVRELDGLKNSHRVSDEASGPQNISKLARDANDWIFTCLAQRCPTVKGQGLKERIDKFASKDDAILDCCLYYKAEYKHTLQILFSNDKNLCLKALMNEVLTISYHKEMSAQLIAQKIYEENMLRYGYIDPSTIANIEVEVPNKGHAGSSEQVCENVYSEILQVSIYVVGQMMAHAYGEDIALIRDFDPHAISNLEKAVEVIIRFWIPVFSQSLRGHEPFEEHGSRKVPIMVDPPRSDHELLHFVEYWAKLLLRLYQKNRDMDGIEEVEAQAKRWSDLARSLV